MIRTKENPRIHIRTSKMEEKKNKVTGKEKSIDKDKNSVKADQKKDDLKKSKNKTEKWIKTSNKKNNASIKYMAGAGAKALTDQLEGGEEIQQSAYIAYGGVRVISDSTSKGSDLLKKRIQDEKKRKLKIISSAKQKQKQMAAKKVTKAATKKATKEVTKESVKFAAKVGASTAGTATTGVAGPLIGMAAGKISGDKIDKKNLASFSRNRKIKFFLDKMKAQNEQNDNFLKLVKDLISAKMMFVLKKAIVSILGYLLALVLIIAAAAIPVIAVVAIIYNSPFAIFFPPLEDGDTVLTVTSQYEADFNRTVSELAEEHSGCDSGEVIYVDYEGSAAVPSNYYDVIAVYMVKYGVGDTATIMNDTTEANLKAVFDDMCSYQTTTETNTETVENEDGTNTTNTTTVLKVQVSLKSYQDMINEYGFTDDEVEMLEDIMDPEYLAMIGYTGGTGGGSSGSGNPVSELSESDISEIVNGITDESAKQALSFALSKVGYPYSQAYRDSGNYYDCSSLAYYAWKSAGVDISFNGATTAAAEAQGLDEAGKSVSVDEMQPGDLIFYSYVNNGRYKNISHVAIYAGNGKVVEAANESIGVVYRDFINSDSVVMIGRP